MLQEISRWMLGFTKFEIRGDTSRFLTLAARSGLTLWGFQKTTQGMTACIQARYYRLLMPVRRRCGCRMKHESKCGIPFWLHRLSKRVGLAVGLGVFIAMYMFLNSFYWEIKVTGTERLSDAAVLEAAENAGVYLGAAKKNVLPAGAAKRIMYEIPEIGWVSVNTNGCVVDIEIRESEAQPEMVAEKGVSNIVAAHEGVITAIEPEAGMKTVEIGDTVVKGQLLIKGVYTENLDPYTVKTEPLETTALRARGRVKAQTQRQFTAELPWTETIEAETEIREKRYLLIFNLKIPLGFYLQEKGDFRMYCENKKLRIIERELPVGICTESYRHYEVTERQRTEEELKRETLLLLRQLQNEALEGVGGVISEELTYEITEGGCKIVCQALCEEEIGETQEVLFEFPIE